MAFNPQQQYFSVYSHSNSDIQSSQLKKICNEEFLDEKTNPLYSSEIKSKKIPYLKPSISSTEDKFISRISESKMYALKKRLMMPVWLLEGVLLSLGAKEPWFEAIASSRLGKIFASPSHINVKSLIPFFLIWNELISRVFHANSRDNSIKLKLNNYITGTRKDIQEISKDIEHIFSSPLKLFEIKASKKSKAFSMSKTGSLNFIRHAHLEYDVDGVWLTLNLTNSFQEICYPAELKDTKFMDTNNIVSISPIVIQSMGSRANLKKILNYLFLEFSKQESYSNNSNWSSFRIDCKKISTFHKDFLSTAPSFYDHGVLGWNNCAPNKKISDIKNGNKSSGLPHEVICSWQLSDQIKEAYEIENAISQKVMKQSTSYTEAIEHNIKQLSEEEESPTQVQYYKDEFLFPQPPEDELKRIREERLIKKQAYDRELATKTRSAERRMALKSESYIKKSPKKLMTQKLFDDGIVVQKTPASSINIPEKKHNSSPLEDSKKHTFTPAVRSDLGDNEFLVLVSEFYESLKPTQKRAFEKDRKGMNAEQFKAYMSAILQRKQATQL